MKNFYWTQDQNTGYYDNSYHTTTKVFAAMPDAAAKAIGEVEGYTGCQRDDPRIVFCEQVRGITCSDEAYRLIKTLGAKYIDDENWNLVRCLPVEDTEKEN